MIEISEYKDHDAMIVLPDGTSSTLGPILLSSKNILKLII